MTFCWVSVQRPDGGRKELATGGESGQLVSKVPLIVDEEGVLGKGKGEGRLGLAFDEIHESHEKKVPKFHHRNRADSKS